ncbi:ubiquitin carboxyl-terminal hydrolase 14, partial [Tachysurus ichikawai]
GMTFMMMGSADTLPEEPADVCRGHDRGAARFSHETLVCLSVLLMYSGALMSSGANAPSQYITAALRDLYESMDKTSSIFPSIILLQFLHMAFPQFAEKDNQGQYVQQDANECWVQLMRVLQQKLETQEPEIPIQMADGGAAASSTKKNFIYIYFTLRIL